MKVFRWNELHSQETQQTLAEIIGRKKGTALTVGGFDGPHRGHQVLFDAVCEQARAHQLVPGLVTFTRSPGAVKHEEHYPGDVSTLNIRLASFAQNGFEFVVLIDFSDDFGKMSGGVFFDILVKTVRMRYLAVGHDFRCGHRLDTGTAELSARSLRDGFRFDSIRQVTQDGIRISSSAVRKAILSADFALAERLLGHPFLLDFNTSDWSVSGAALEAEKAVFTQILPPEGLYPVFLTFLNGDRAEVHLSIDDGTVRIRMCGDAQLPPPESVAAIQF